MRIPSLTVWLAVMTPIALLGAALSMVGVAPVSEPCAVVRVDTVGARVVRLCDGDTVAIEWRGKFCQRHKGERK